MAKRKVVRIYLDPRIPPEEATAVALVDALNNRRPKIRGRWPRRFIVAPDQQWAQEASSLPS